MNILNLLEKYPELDYLNIKNKEEFFNNFTFHTFNKGSILKGYECPGLIFVLDGTIDIYTINYDGKESYLYSLHQGDYCHKSIYCHIKNKELDIIGYCIEETNVAILPNGLIKEFLLSTPYFLSCIYQDSYLKLINMIQEKNDILTLSIEDRIIKYLKNSNSNVIYITHSQLASYINTSREVVSRNLKKLEKKGIIKIGIGKITLLGKL
ncbi:Crp/Fnr family transcriptional regulator (plasmid) [Clostridium baratii]